VARPRKRRRLAGDIGDLKGVLWDMLLEVEALRHEDEVSKEFVLRVAHALSQLAQTYLKTLEVCDLAAEIAALKAAVHEQRERP
jgi:hypothetical protein